MKKIALVTYKKEPHLNSGDKLLVKPFQKFGYTIDPVPWNDVRIDWKTYDSVILRSCWDYHIQYPQFILWLEKLRNLNIRLWNQYDIIRWNTQKTYLFDLEKKQVPIISTTLIKKGQKNHVEEIIRKSKWEEIVIKPIIGASAYKIFKVKLKDLNCYIPKIYELLSNEDILIQPFVNEIVQNGEYSFVFFDKKYSHTILRKPKQGDYRNQPEFGVTEHLIHPKGHLIDQAERILYSIDSPLLYARIDTVDFEGKLHLIELELTEPYLFFEFDENSAEKFVTSFVKLNFPD
jgi:glutathione synthase/RimK-type ligase-like ATP-grasp enzyme